MDLKLGKGFDKLGGLVDEFVSRDAGLAKAMSGCELSIGDSRDPNFGVPAHAMSDPIFVGDEQLIGQTLRTAAGDAMFKADQSKVQVRPVYNFETKKYDLKMCIAGDDGFDPIAGQLFSPQNIAYLSKVWKQTV